MPSGRKAEQPARPKLPPATTVEARENQLVALAFDVAEEQMRNGTASAQIISHYLKLGSTRERLEQENLRRDLELKRIKAEAIESAKDAEAMYRQALEAMQIYSGNAVVEDD